MSECKRKEDCRGVTSPPTLLLTFQSDSPVLFVGRDHAVHILVEVGRGVKYV